LAAAVKFKKVISPPAERRCPMQEKDSVRQSLQEMIHRVAGGSGSDEEVRVLPDILGIYFERFGGKKSRLEQFRAEQEREGAEARAAVPIISALPFPTEGFVTGAQAAVFLGYGDLKNPEGKIRRLANEGVIPAPVRRGNRAFRYDAAAIRAHKARLDADREKAS
jgi:hypothetical protein